MRYLILLIIINLCCNAHYTNKFRFCSRSDPNLNECLKSAIQDSLYTLQNGIPEIDVPSLNPMTLLQYTAKASAALNFDQTYKNIKLFGHVHCEVRDVKAKITDTELTLVLNAYNHNITFVADYEYKNALVNGMDVSSDGVLTLHCGMYKHTVTLTGIVTQNGKSRNLSITNVTLNDATIQSAFVKVKSGNVNAAEIITKTINDNWEAVMAKEMKDISEIYAETYKKEANAVFSKIQFDELFPK